MILIVTIYWQQKVQLSYRGSVVLVIFCVKSGIYIGGTVNNTNEYYEIWLKGIIRKLDSVHFHTKFLYIGFYLLFEFKNKRIESILSLNFSFLYEH